MFTQERVGGEENTVLVVVVVVVVVAFDSMRLVKFKMQSERE